MEEKTGIDIIPEIKSISPKTKIIMITSFDDSEYIFNAFANGADNYISKTEDIDYIVKTIKEFFKCYFDNKKNNIVKEYNYTFKSDNNMDIDVIKRIF